MKDARRGPVWAAVFGAAFVEDFRRFYETESFVKALEHASVERALTIANAAVEKLRAWEAENAGEEAASESEPPQAPPEAVSLEDAAGITDVIRGTAAQGEEK